MADCPKCRRIAPPQWNGCEDTFRFIEGGEVCRAVADGYRRGVRDMLAVAKRHATAHVVDDFGAEAAEIDWSDVEREAAKLAGEGT